MAERRMFAKSITESDAFLDMPASTQNLYFHLGMYADDEGFINNPKTIMRIVGSKEDDLKLLITKKFLIIFESGLIVIKHWKINNNIQKDRFKPTKYQDEKSLLELDENKAYRVINTCIQNGYKMDTQVSIGKVSIGKVSKENTLAKSDSSESSPQEIIPCITLTLNDKSEYGVVEDQLKEWQELYPNADVMAELRKMKGWLEANPTKRKTRRGILRFINGWLTRAQDKPKKMIGYPTPRKLPSWYTREDEDYEKASEEELAEFEKMLEGMKK